MLTRDKCSLSIIVLWLIRLILNFGFFCPVFSGCLQKLIADIPHLALVSYLVNELLHGLATDDQSPIVRVIPGVYAKMAWRLAMTSFLQRLHFDGDAAAESIFQVIGCTLCCQNN